MMKNYKRNVFCLGLFILSFSSSVLAWHPLEGDFSWDGSVALGEIPSPLVIVTPIPGGLQPYYGTECGSSESTIPTKEIVPDGMKVPGFDVKIEVHQVCQEHDTCYDQQLGKEYCDDAFLDGIIAKCDAELTGGWSIFKDECHLKARLYYELMRRNSGDAYDAAGGGPSPSYEPLPEYNIVAERKIALQASNGQYVVAEGGGGQEVNADRDNIASWETLTLIELGDNNIALQAVNGLYVVAEGGGGQVVYANRSHVGPWEVFKLIELGGGSIALQASNGQYMVAENGGGQEVNANRDNIGPWETFTLIELETQEGLALDGAEAELVGSMLHPKGTLAALLVVL